MFSNGAGALKSGNVKIKFCVAVKTREWELSGIITISPRTSNCIYKLGKYKHFELNCVQTLNANCYHVTETPTSTKLPKVEIQKKTKKMHF